MLHVFANAGFGVRRGSAGGDVHLALDLRPTVTLAERIDDRTHAATVASLRALLAPRVDRRRRRPARAGRGRRRDLPRRSSRAASAASRRPCTPTSASSAPRAPSRRCRTSTSRAELASWPSPAGEVLGVAREAAEAGVRALLVVSTGFADTDEPEGVARQEALLAEVARAHGLRLVGPNALGVVNTDPDGRRCRRSSAACRCAPAAWGCRRSPARSGLALLGHAAARRMGVSSFLALGNRADVSTNDVLEHFADDERTTVVAFYVESFGNPRRFAQVARRVSRRKPILAVKGSRPRDGATAPAAAHRRGADRRGADRGAVRAGRRDARARARRRSSTRPSCSSASRCRPGAASAS